MLSLATLNVVILVLETLLYAILLVLCCIVFYLRSVRLSQSGYSRWTRWVANPVVLPMLALLLACTGHLAITIVRYSYAALGDRAHPQSFNGINSFVKRGQLQKAANVLSIFSLWVGDGIIVHRLWVIWNYSFWVIVVPCASLAGIISCSIAGLHTLFRENRFNETTMTINWVMRIVTNFYCTGFIAWRILRTRVSKEREAKSVLAALVFIVESAAILAAWTLFFAVTYEMQTQLLLVAINLTPQVVGLTNILIHLRIGMTRANEDDGEGTGMSLTSPGSMVGVNVTVTLPELEAAWLDVDTETDVGTEKTGDGMSVSTVPPSDKPS